MSNKYKTLIGCLFSGFLFCSGIGNAHAQLQNAFVHENPDYQHAIEQLQLHGPITAKPTFHVYAASDMKSPASPAQANLYYGSKACEVAMKEQVDDDNFVLRIMNATGWDKRTSILFIVAHEVQHCDDFEKLNRILHGVATEYSNEVLAGLLPFSSWVDGIVKSSDPWTSYIQKSKDYRAQRLAEASSDIGALLVVHKAYGVSKRQVRDLAKLRADDTQPGYDLVHDTSPWLRMFMEVLDKSSIDGQGDILKAMDAAQSSRFIYKLLKGKN